MERDQRHGPRCHGRATDRADITLNGQPATGGQVESEMHEEMAKGSLRTYQLVAAKDWIEQFKATIVRPGPSADGIVGNGHSDRKNGAEIQLTHGLDSFFVQPDGYATVGGLFAGEHAIATAIMLGVNRPNYVEAALWRALDPTSAPKTRVSALLDRIATALAPPRSAAGAGKPSRKPRSHRPDEILAAGPDAKAAYADLQAVLWPQRTLDAAAQAKLEARAAPR